MPNLISSRILRDRIFKVVLIALVLAATLPLFSILIYVYSKGLPQIHWSFFTHLPKAPGESGGGISNALVGTLLLIFFSSLVAIPLGILAGIYLSEYRSSKLADIVRVSVEILQGTPSIVIGIVAYLWIVKTMRGFSVISGAAALGIMMLPGIVRTTEETLRLIPHSLKEASLALGVPYHRTILQVIVPSGLSGILTGVLLSVARISGETAPLLFTAFGNPFMNTNPLKPANALPLLIFNNATSPDREWQTVAWGASVVLITMVLFLNLIARLGIKRWKVQF